MAAGDGELTRSAPPSEPPAAPEPPAGVAAIRGRLVAYDASCDRVPFAFGVVEDSGGGQHFFGRCHLGRGIIAELLQVGEPLEFHVFSPEAPRGPARVPWAYNITRPSTERRRVQRPSVDVRVVGQGEPSGLPAAAAGESSAPPPTPSAASSRPTRWKGSLATRLPAEQHSVLVTRVAAAKGPARVSSAAAAVAQLPDRARGTEAAGAGKSAGKWPPGATRPTAASFGKFARLAALAKARAAVAAAASMRANDVAAPKRALAGGAAPRVARPRLLNDEDQDVTLAQLARRAPQAAAVADGVDAQQRAKALAAPAPAQADPLPGAADLAPASEEAPADADVRDPGSQVNDGVAADAAGAAAKAPVGPRRRRHSKPAPALSRYCKEEEISLAHMASTLLRLNSSETGWKAALEEYFALPLQGLLDDEIAHVNRVIASEFDAIGVRGRLPRVMASGVELAA